MNKIMNEAIKSANKGMEEKKGGPFGAAIVDKNNKIISIFIIQYHIFNVYIFV